MDGYGKLKIGANVDIQRTDGRIHPAVVSGINRESQSVTVEWFEKGETKGKEIELQAILDLNPDIAPDISPPEIIRSLPSKTKNASRQSISIATCNKNPVSSVSTRSRNTLAAASGIANGSSSNVFAVPTVPAPRAALVDAPPANVTNGASQVIGTVTRASAAFQLHHQQQQQQQQQQVAAAAAAAAAAEKEKGAAARRRSNVVKNVEKLAKNREERRARQAEMKEEKEALMNVDPGNPNWEFLSMIRDFRSTLEYRPLRDNEPVEDHQITVCVRKRPLNKKEVTRKEVDVITVPTKDRIVVHEPKNKVDLTKYLENQHFRIDYAFDETCNNETVYKYTAKPLVQTIFEGGMATCFAYGQTGSGKTHTMGGDFQGKTQDCAKGIYALAARDVFRLFGSPKYRNLDLVVSASFFEIYSGKVFDLLNNKNKLRVLEDGKQQVQLVGLSEKVVDSVEEVLKLIQHGNSVRTSGQTSANAHSSRSHAVFQIVLRSRTNHRVHGKFSLVDLAGNERGADTSSSNRQTRMEGAEINKSLLALKECIRALGRKGAHLPFRASKLTQVLRDSFIGEKSKTCMIAMISPGMSSCEHSLNTLRYADRVKELSVTDTADKEPSDDLALIEDQDMGSESDLGDAEERDLAQLRSLNEGELSADMYNFHAAVSHLQEEEEEVLDAHKVLLEDFPKWGANLKSLYTMSMEVDYDVDAYAQQLEDVLAESAESILQLKNKVANFRAQLLAEEEFSRNINPGNGRLNY